VPEFLRRAGIAYTELVELVKTQFINPHQRTLDFLQRFFVHSSVGPDAFYAKLKQIETEALNPADDADITAALSAYNSPQETKITAEDFGEWVKAHLGEFRQVITLYEPDSQCNMATTKLRTLQSIYEGSDTSGRSEPNWSKIHRIIRLYRKLGWTMHETDLMLAALGEENITPPTIGKLGSVALLQTATKLPVDQLAVLWGHIDTSGDTSLYKKLFLNKAVQQIDDAFKADAWGHYLGDTSKILANHQSAMLAAFRISNEDLVAILGVAKVIDKVGNPAPPICAPSTSRRTS